MRQIFQNKFDATEQCPHKQKKRDVLICSLCTLTNYQKTCSIESKKY